MTPFSDTVSARFLHRLARVVCQYPKWFVYPQVGLALAGVLYTAARLKLDVNRDHLVGATLRQLQVYLQYRTGFPPEDELVVVVQSGRQERNRQFGERLAARVVPETNHFSSLFYKGDLATLGPKALLLLPTEDLEDMRRALHRRRQMIQEFAQATNLNSFFSRVSKKFRTAPMSGTAATVLRNSYEQAAGYALLAIALAVWLHFRWLVAVALALLPVGIGTAWLLGWMGLAGIPFNPANFITLPLLVGIGVTNGIQMLNRFAEEQKLSILAKSTGKAVLVSGLTAMAGFGTLMFASHHGIKSLGEVMSVGIAACMAAVLLVLPALLRLLTHWGWTLHPD